MNGETGSSLPEKRFQGLGVSPGLARGQVFIHRPEQDATPDYTIREEDVPAEIARFESALLLTRTQILDMQAKLADAIGVEGREHFRRAPARGRGSDAHRRGPAHPPA